MQLLPVNNPTLPSISQLWQLSIAELVAIHLIGDSNSKGWIEDEDMKFWGGGFDISFGGKFGGGGVAGCQDAAAGKAQFFPRLKAIDYGYGMRIKQSLTDL